MGNRAHRARTAHETIAILDAGHYETLSGSSVEIAADLAAAVERTALYEPEQLAAMLDGLAPSEGGRTPVLEVRNCTTFAAAKSLVDGGGSEPLCLNFASAKNPGGGFLGGSQAQEEALARASGLYASLLAQPEYYERNRAFRSSLYTDHMIYSPGVPVFRDDDDNLLDEPYRVSIVTAPAPNAGAVRANEPHNIAHIAPTMGRRIQHVLAVAHDNGHDQLVLGAWGCGVFGNDPATVAGIFAGALDDPRFRGAFSTIVFAVLDFSPTLDTFRPFEATLAS